MENLDQGDDSLTAEYIEEEEDGEQVQKGEEALVVVQGAEHINININIKICAGGSGLNIIRDININISSAGG